jgi:hypothetical protein
MANIESNTQKRKKYMQIVSRKRKYTKFEIDSWKKQDEEEQRNRDVLSELDGEALRHFSEI